MFCPWVLTWLSNTTSKQPEAGQQVLRIWDYLICSERTSMVFFCAAVILLHIPDLGELDMMEMSTRFKQIELGPEMIEELVLKADSLASTLAADKTFVEGFNSSLLTEYTPVTSAPNSPSASSRPLGGCRCPSFPPRHNLDVHEICC